MASNPIFHVALSRVGRGVAMGRSPTQGVLPKCLQVFIVSGVRYDSEVSREPNVMLYL
jgi:hypothetical protein